MKLKSLELRNFHKFTNLEIDYDGRVTRLVGVNGSGKSSILTAMWACLKGIAEKGKGEQLIGERYRFIGPEEDFADIKMVMIDDERDNVSVEVSNHITEKGNKIEFKAPEGYRVGENWIENLLSVALMSAKNFSQLSGKQQSLVLDIDTTKYDTKMDSLKQEFKSVNRDFRAFGDIPRREKVESVAVLDLVKEKDKIDKRNRKLEDQRTEKTNLIAGLAKMRDREVEVRKELDNIESEITGAEGQLDNFPEIAKNKPTTSIVKQIGESEEINIAAAEWEKNEQARQDKVEKKKELDRNKDEQNALAKRRLKYIQGALKVPVEGLSVNEKGELMLTEKPIREPFFSKGELEVAVARIYAATNPELKVRFIDDFELLDAGNQKSIVEDLLESGFQIITAEVRTPKGVKGVITLRECAKVSTK